MALPKPALLPEWATEDQQNPISGQWNVVVPPDEKKLSGWTLGEKPNRQWWNWFNRTVFDWIAYLDSIFGSSAASQTITPNWDGLTVQPSVNFFYYSLVGDKCFINGNIQWSGNADTTTTLRINNLPFRAKNISGYLQCIQVERGTAVTMPNGKTLYANLNANTTNLIFRETDLSAGSTIDTIDKGATGTLRFSGYYIIEPA